MNSWSAKSGALPASSLGLLWTLENLSHEFRLVVAEEGGLRGKTPQEIVFQGDVLRPELWVGAEQIAEGQEIFGRLGTPRMNVEMVGPRVAFPEEAMLEVVRMVDEGVAEGRERLDATVGFAEIADEQQDVDDGLRDDL